MIYLKIYLTFFKIGLFTIGGGLAALPLLQDSLVTNNWVSQQEFIDMIAVSQSTPGPIGINMATYAGFKTQGVLGALAATAGMISPSLIIIILIARFMHHYNEHRYVQAVLNALRPAAIGLIGAAAWYIFSKSVIQFAPAPQSGLEWKPILIFILLGLGYHFKKFHPIVFILSGGILGILFL